MASSYHVSRFLKTSVRWRRNVRIVDPAIIASNFCVDRKIKMVSSPKWSQPMVRMMRGLAW